MRTLLPQIFYVLGSLCFLIGTLLVIFRSLPR